MLFLLIVGFITDSNNTLPCVLYSYLKLSDSVEYREGKMKKIAVAFEIAILNFVFLKSVKFLKNS